MLLLEHWKPIPGFENFEVSITGRIQHRDRMRPRKTKLKYGYPEITLTSPGKPSRTFYVHVLVAAAFHGPRPGSLEVNHKDGDKRNMRASNFEYITHQDNIDHAWSTGLMSSKKAKLSEADHVLILDNPENLTNADLARKLEVHESYICRLRKAAGLARCQPAKPQVAKTQMPPSRKTVAVRVFEPEERALKLTPTDVLAIREQATTSRVDDVAQRFRVNRSTIYQILRGEIWSHIA